MACTTIFAARPCRALMGTLALITIACASACQTSRPTEVVRASGDREFEMQRYDTAAAEYEIILERYPGDWQARLQAGRCYLELNQPARAMQTLEIAHNERPLNVEIADAYAEALYQAGEADRLFAFLRDQASQRQTTHAWLRLAKYSILMRDPDSAETAVETAIAIDEGQTVEPYLVAANLAQELGQVDQAVRRLRQAYGIDPYDERVRDRLRELGEIPGPTLALPPDR